MRENNLFNALLKLFSESDAFLLTELLKNNLYKKTIRYEEININEKQKKDLILLAFEERIMIPVKSRSGPAWEDKILDYRKEGLYFIPPVVKAIVDTICETGLPSSDAAVRNTLTNVSQEDRRSFIKLLQTIMKQAGNYTFEVGLLEIFFKEADMDGDLHDIIDIFVIYGIMSPCPQKSLMTCLSWFEINPTLYWDKSFIS
jgi:hypothetical protein